MSRYAYLALGVVLIARAAVGQGGGTLKFTSPAPDSYLSGSTRLAVTYDGPGGDDAILDVTYYVAGKEVCVVSGRGICDWDAGDAVESHALRAAARLKAGGRVIANLRTKALAFAQAVSVDIIQVNAVVMSGGRLVRDLPKEAFRLLDDRQERPITSLQAVGAPIDVVLAVDVSESMKEVLQEVRRAATTFLRALGDQHQATIVAFNDDVFTLAQWESSIPERLAALDKLSAWGGTALYDVIAESIELTSRRAGRKAVVVFSDGEDRTSTTTLADLKMVIDQSDATVFAIGFGRGVTDRGLRQTLESLAEASGGFAVFADNADDLAESFEDVLEALSNQYTLAFEPRRDGKYHQIEVQVPGRGVRVRARRGYVAPVQ